MEVEVVCWDFDNVNNLNIFQLDGHTVPSTVQRYMTVLQHAQSNVNMHIYSLYESVYISSGSNILITINNIHEYEKRKNTFIYARVEYE